MREEPAKLGPLKDQTSQKNPYRGAVVLTLAALFVKVLSALYKVPFQNLTGDAGFYVYQQVYPLYGVAVVLSFSGLPVFISKILSDLDNPLDQTDMVRQIFTGLAILGVGIWAILFGFAGGIARLMGDENLAPVIQSTSFFYLVMPFMASFRGFFQGQGEMTPTGISQVFEQVIRIIVILWVAFTFTRSSWSIYQMGTLAMASAFTSGLVAVLVLLVYLNKTSVKVRTFLKCQVPSKTLVRRFFDEGLEIVFLASLLVFFQFIDSFTVYNGLLAGGLDDGLAVIAKGIYDRGQPFAQLGLTVALALSTSLLPALTYSYKIKDWQTWNHQAKSSVKLTLVLSSATSMGLVAVMPWLNWALFDDLAHQPALQVYILSVFFVSVSLVCQSVLQSTNQKTGIKKAIFLALAFKILVNTWLVSQLGILGSSLVTVLATGGLALYMVWILPKEIKGQVMGAAYLLKLGAANLAMVALVTLVGHFLPLSSRLGALLAVLGLSALGFIFYLLLVIKWKLLSNQELRELPGASTLEKVGILKWTPSK